ncbi:MAG TPA: UDP-4-amino-4,6-dideoxy-N-acetyl-beta-L-altrosamine transaminase [Caulobacteraceae bacterium]|jgi:UDP-4-amino-4,6-dideoxy-N-acetyl-beta-L-altrosamine transaminase
MSAAADHLPYGRHLIEDDDVAAVTAALRSEMIAHGPRVGAFETALAASVGAAEAVACSSGTAALHLALAGLDVGPGDLCVVPSITFLATATAALFCGADVVFADVDPATGLMTAETLAQALGRAPKPARVVLPVHLGGRLCDMAAISAVARADGALLVEDAAHALGSRGPDGSAGDCALSDAATFSFHPVKTIACGEGGAVTTNDAKRAQRMRRLRNHAVVKEGFTDPTLSLDTEGRANPWSYEQNELGFNYRMNELEAALGLSQLGKLARFAARRSELARLYDAALAPLAPVLTLVPPGPGQSASLHLYVVRIDFAAAGATRAALMRSLAEEGIGTQVHYIPLHRQPYFRRRYGEQRLPGADAWYEQVLALPLFPAMRDEDVARVAEALTRRLARA